MNFQLHKNAAGLRFWFGLVVLGFGLAIQSAAADSVKGLYVGSEFYAPNETAQNAARASGFTRLFLSFFHVDERGDITYNNTPVVRDGVYVGDPSWGVKLAEMLQPPTGVNRIELAFGDGPGVRGGGEDASFANIQNLIATQGVGPDSILYRDFRALKEATGVGIIQLVDERTYDAPATVALGQMLAGLGLKITFCASTNLDFWSRTVATLGATNVEALYLVCYGDGATNDPARWGPAFPGIAVYPGLWGNTDTPTSAMLKLRGWRESLGLAGGFVWLNGFLPADASKWSGAMVYALDSVAELRIINKNSGKSLELIRGKLDNGAAIGQAAYAASANQRWLLVPSEQGGHFKLVSWVSGKCASIAYDSSVNGAQLWAWDYNNDPSQQFDLIDAGNGWFEIKNVRSGLRLEVAGGSTSDNAVVQQNAPTGAASQLWRIYPYAPALLASEDFDYPAGELNGQGGGEGWNGAWSDVLNPGTRVAAGGLSGGTNVPTGFDAQSAGNSAFIPNDTRAGRYLDCSVGGNFGAYGYLDSNGRIGADGTTVYLSFLEQPGKTSLFYEFELNRGTERIGGIGNDTRTDQVNLRAPGSRFAAIGPGDTNVNFYVMRIDFKAGNDDVRVYRNPTGTIEPEVADLTLHDRADLAFNRISLAAFANSNTVKFDQIRLASSWPEAIAAAPEYTLGSAAKLGREDLFRRVTISGQVLSGSRDKYYLLDGNTGLQVWLNWGTAFEPGDMVVVSGLVQRQASWVNLIEAEARKAGHQPLPSPQPLVQSDDATAAAWVAVEGTLTALKDVGPDRILELQIGSNKWVARYPAATKVSATWPLGSRLKLTGVYLPRNDDDADHAGENSLLLNSAAAVELLARPPWWTPRRALAAVALLAAGLALAFVWIRSLQGQVNRQTVRLRAEILQREHAERARVIEEERSRISRDLHDDLGSILTQINLLANPTSTTKLPMDSLRDRIRQISEKSLRMITALDEVVWMMNAKNESLSSLAAYLAAYTEEFLSKTNIICRIESPRSYPEKAVTAEVRNHAFSAVKEALNNAVRHGRPGKVLLKLSVTDSRLEIQVRDDGVGFDLVQAKPGNGLANLRLRMQKISGTCEIQTSPGSGTTVILQLPLVPLSA